MVKFHDYPFHLFISFMFYNLNEKEYKKWLGCLLKCCCCLVDENISIGVNLILSQHIYTKCYNFKGNEGAFILIVRKIYVFLDYICTEYLLEMFWWIATSFWLSRQIIIVETIFIFFHGKFI